MRPRDEWHEWTNDQSSAQPVYFLVDAYKDDAGTFTLEWTYTLPEPTEQPTEGQGFKKNVSEPYRRDFGTAIAVPKSDFLAELGTAIAVPKCK